MRGGRYPYIDEAIARGPIAEVHRGPVAITSAGSTRAPIRTIARPVAPVSEQGSKSPQRSVSTAPINERKREEEIEMNNEKFVTDLMTTTMQRLSLPAAAEVDGQLAGIIKNTLANKKFSLSSSQKSALEAGKKKLEERTAEFDKVQARALPNAQSDEIDRRMGINQSTTRPRWNGSSREYPSAMSKEAARETLKRNGVAR